MIKNFQDFLNESRSILDPKTIAEKFHIFATASEVPVKVTDLEEKAGNYTFEIFTNLPHDMAESGDKEFVVVVPKDSTKVPYVETYEGRKKVLTTRLETEAEDLIKILLTDFIEATELFDDPFIQTITDKHQEIKTAEDVKRLNKHTL
jgi:hypothetical protein